MNAAFENRIAGREISVVNTMTEDERTRLLSFAIFPDDTEQQDRIDTAAQTPDSSGRILCWRRRRQCNNPQCIDSATGKQYQFKATDRELWNCPLCGHDRHCRNKVKSPNRGCRKHGGGTPVGWDLPQTKTGEFSKHIKVDSLRDNFQEMLASPQLFDLTENIAFLKARINEITAEFGGGLSRDLLENMEQIRKAFKAELSKPIVQDADGKTISGPNLILLRQLDDELDELIAKGSHNYQVQEDWGKATGQLERLIASRDKHVNNERSMITPDKAWMMLSFVEETFTLGLNMMVEFDEKELNELFQNMEVEFPEELTPKEIVKMKEGLYIFLKAKEKKMLSYASQRFKELSESGKV